MRAAKVGAGPPRSTVGLGEHKRAAGGDVAEAIEVLPKHRGGVHEASAVESEFPSEAKLRAIFSRTLIEHGLMPVSASSDSTSALHGHM